MGSDDPFLFDKERHVEKVKLYAAKDLNGVPTGFVVEIAILPFVKAPDVIVWGTRCFLLHDKRQPLVYVEGFCYVYPATAA